MGPNSGRIGYDALITLIAIVAIVTALATVFSTALVAVGLAAAVFLAP